MKRFARRSLARKINIQEGADNCLYIGRLDASSIVIDVGCAGDADFSLLLIKKFKLKSYGIDPTKKHLEPLRRITSKTGGRFTHLPLAVSDVTGELTFHESITNVSGSLCKEHHNIQNDPTRSYKVASVTLEDLLSKLNLKGADFLKLDLEGAEYCLLSKISDETLGKFGQIFIEFHHHCMDQYTASETQILVDKIKSHGYHAFSYDDHNYLFYRP